MKNILEGEESLEKFGCDFTLLLDKACVGGEIKLLQLTDMQVIDSSQMRTPDRLRSDEIRAWMPENYDAMCADHIRSLVCQTSPDLIFITGDIIYGSFDDSGRVFDWFCDFMDSLEIPWAPIFGNHDNESKIGVAWQCGRFEKSEYCLFKRGCVSGNGNYSVGIAAGNRLIRVLHMIDSNGCKNSDDPEVIKAKGIFPDQLALVHENAERARAVNKKHVPGFLAFHIPHEEFLNAEIAKGYKTDERDFYTIGVDVQPKDGDFGCRLERYEPIKTEGNFIEFLHGCDIDAVFTGHEHKINTSIKYKDIQWVFGLKTGQYDYHTPGQIGGTLVSLFGEKFTVRHIPSLVHCAPYPYGAKMFKNFFVDEE